MTPAFCSWEPNSRREDFATWLCWHGCDVRNGLRTRRNVCFKASFLSLIKTTKARLAFSPAEPENYVLVPSGRKPSKTWQWTGAKRPRAAAVAPAAPKGTAAGWHQAGTCPAALPRPPPALLLCTAVRLLFGLEIRAMPARSTMFPRNRNPGGKRQRGAGGAAAAAGRRAHPPGLPPLPCANTHLIQASAPRRCETQRLDFLAV